MTEWGYYIPPKAWLGKKPQTAEGVLDIKQFGDIVHEVIVSGVRIRACCDGLFLFDFSQATKFQVEDDANFASAAPFSVMAKARLVLAEVFNAHAVCLRESLSKLQLWTFPYQAITPHDLLPCDFSGTRLSISFKNDYDSHLFAARFTSQYLPDIPTMFDSRVSNRGFVIEPATLEDAAQRLNTLISQPKLGLLYICALFNWAATSLQDYDYPRSLITSWAIIEHHLEKLWERYIAENRTRLVSGEQTTFINCDRKKRLTEGREYTASVRAEILSLVDVLPLRLYNDISTIRGVRNDWMHSLEEVSLDSVRLALLITSILAKMVYDFDLPTNVSLSL